MMKISRSMMVAAATCTLALPAFAQSPGYAQQASPPGQQAVPAWVQPWTWGVGAPTSRGEGIWHQSSPRMSAR
jgi:hypothetical protein